MDIWQLIISVNHYYDRYQKWLDAPETGIIPDDLDFIKRELI